MHKRRTKARLGPTRAAVIDERLPAALQCPPAGTTIFSPPTRAPRVPAFTMPSSRSRTCTCKGGPADLGGSVPSRYRTIRPSGSRLRCIRKISPLWRFSKVRKSSTIPSPCFGFRAEVLLGLVKRVVSVMAIFHQFTYAAMKQMRRTSCRFSGILRTSRHAWSKRDVEPTSRGDGSVVA